MHLLNEFYRDIILGKSMNDISIPARPLQKFLIKKVVDIAYGFESKKSWGVPR